MAQKIDNNFIQFVKSKSYKKHKSNDDEEEEEPKQLRIFSQKKNQSINYLICEKTAKQNEENEKQSIGNWLKENGNKVIVNKYKPTKQLKSQDDDSDDNESDDYESDDYEEEKINHFISNKRERENEEEDSEEAELETINEMKYLSNKNEGALTGDYNNDGDDDLDEEENEADDDEDIKEKEEDEEDEPEPKPKPKQQPKQTKPKKEFKTNISNTVFISNFPKTFNESAIEKYLSKYGDIRTIRLMKTKEGESKGFGYVDYESTKGMKTAIGAILQIKGKDIKIEEAKSSFINLPIDSNQKNHKRLGKKKKKALKNKEKESKRQLHRKNQLEKQQDNRPVRLRMNKK